MFLNDQIVTAEWMPRCKGLNLLIKGSVNLHQLPWESFQGVGPRLLGSLCTTAGSMPPGAGSPTCASLAKASMPENSR